jgi:hypothetical protein
MVWVSRFGWNIETGDQPPDGTDSRVAVTILRHDVPQITLNVEPGASPRLNVGTSEFHSWRWAGTTLDQDDDIVTWPAGRPFPDAIEFRSPLQGHLTFRFEIFGNDVWVKDTIDTYVRYTKPEHVPGTLDSDRWVEDAFWTHTGTFARDVSMRTDTVADRVFTRLTLNV